MPPRARPGARKTLRLAYLKFAAVAQPAVRKVIAEQLGAEGTAMLNAMLAEIDKASK